MPKAKDFNASNEPGTCLWCGTPLKHERINVWERVETSTGFHHERVGQKNLFDKPGYMGNGFFCTLRCGFDFAKSFAKQGKRFAPLPKPVAR